ncbi:MAG: class I SAM-dependent methyltransferase [Nibricoccus sp.]
MASDNASAHPANRYDAEIRRIIPFYDALQSEALDIVRATVGSPETWLDTGCGTGIFVERALAAFPRTRFVAVDPSAAMLAEAKTRLGDNERLSFLVPVGSEKLLSITPRLRVQVITAMLCHHYFEPAGRVAAVQSCYEILEPGGVLVVVENIDCDSLAGRTTGLDRWRDYQKSQGRSEPEVQAHIARFGIELKPIKIEDHLEVLKSAGFSCVEIFWRAQMQAGFYAVK